MNFGITILTIQSQVFSVNVQYVKLVTVLITLIVENMFCIAELKLFPDIKIVLSRNLKIFYSIVIVFSSHLSFDTSFCEFKLKTLRNT